MRAAVRARSRPFAQTAHLQGLRPRGQTGANPSERRTLPFLPRKRLATRKGVNMAAKTLVRERGVGAMPQLWSSLSGPQ
jgi:hypothetical protein